jgi:hypothetical protein
MNECNVKCKPIKKIKLTIYDTTVINTFSNKIICEGFKGCTKKIIDEIYKIYENINNINNKNTIFIENIIEISKDELMQIYKDFIKEFNF